MAEKITKLAKSKTTPTLNDKVTKEKLDHYFKITGDALKMASKAQKMPGKEPEALDFLDMASRYYSDAKYFMEKNDYVLAFAALNYAHGWLDAGARIKLFKVNDSRLFTVDDD
ncbi:MAG: DUF357 domain-containing protein [Candidatus Woesearchaeota archaeon]|jgi:hypothetical protein